MLSKPLRLHHSCSQPPADSIVDFQGKFVDSAHRNESQIKDAGVHA